MNLLTRYILREVGSVFLVTLAVLTFLLIGLGVGKEAMQQGLAAKHVVQLIPYVLPNALLFAIPGTILFSVSSVYGRLSGANEIVALKSLGVHPIKIIFPVLLFATGLSLLTVWLNDVATSWGYQGVQQVVINGVEEIIYGVLRQQGSYSNEHLSLSVEEVEGSRLITPYISLHATDDMPEVVVSAEEAEIHSEPGSGKLTLRCTNGFVEVGEQRFDFPDTLEQELPLPVRQVELSASHVALGNVPSRLAEARFELVDLSAQAAVEVGHDYLLGNFAAFINPHTEHLRRQLEDTQREIKRLLVEGPRRWANGFSCLCFAMVGIPVAIRLRNSDYFTSFFACFLPILLVYYPLLIWSLDRAKAGAIPPLTLVSGNAVLAVWGLAVLRQVIRY